MSLFLKSFFGRFDSHSATCFEKCQQAAPVGIFNQQHPVEGFPSGQRDQTVNLTALPSKVRILPPPPPACLIKPSRKPGLFCAPSGRVRPGALRQSDRLCAVSGLRSAVSVRIDRPSCLSWARGGKRLFRIFPFLCEACIMAAASVGVYHRSLFAVLWRHGEPVTINVTGSPMRAGSSGMIRSC